MILHRDQRLEKIHATDLRKWDIMVACCCGYAEFSNAIFGFMPLFLVFLINLSLHFILCFNLSFVQNFQISKFVIANYSCLYTISFDVCDNYYAIAISKKESMNLLMQNFYCCLYFIRIKILLFGYSHMKICFSLCAYLSFSVL